jgi:hypothetical protein
MLQLLQLKLHVLKFTKKEQNSINLSLYNELAKNKHLLSEALIKGH